MELTDKELATVLAALRYFQNNGRFARYKSEHFAEHRPLADSEIDGLCERLNLGEAKAKPCLEDRINDKMKALANHLNPSENKSFLLIPVSKFGESEGRRLMHATAEAIDRLNPAWCRGPYTIDGPHGPACVHGWNGVHEISEEDKGE